jgi:hypothetical protein
MRANTRIKQSKLVAALGSAIAIGMGIGLAHAGGIFSGPATAAIKVSDGVHTVICMDNDPCDGKPAITGEVLYTDGLDGWFVNVDTGLSKDVLGTANNPKMDLSYQVAYNTFFQVPGDGTLTIMFSDTGFLPSPAGFLSAIGGTFANGVTSVTVADYASSTNSLFDLGSLICTETFTKTSPYSGSCGGKYTGATPYSLTEVITLTDANRVNGQSSGDHSLVEAPEPGTLLLMGVALAGLGFVSRRRGDQA